MNALPRAFEWCAPLSENDSCRATREPRDVAMSPSVDVIRSMRL